MASPRERLHAQKKHDKDVSKNLPPKVRHGARRGRQAAQCKCMMLFEQGVTRDAKKFTSRKKGGFARYLVCVSPDPTGVNRDSL